MKRAHFLLAVSLCLGGCASMKVPKEQSATAKSEEIDNGYVVVDVTLTDGKLTKVSIDETGAVSFDGESTGTKKQLGEKYGMKPLSAINKEWFEQIKALEEYMVDHGVDAIKTDGKYATNDDLKTTVTVSIDKYLEVTKEAIALAKEQK